MPVNVVKSVMDEKAWRRAKRKVASEYPTVKGDRKYKLIMSIFKNMRKK